MPQDKNETPSVLLLVLTYNGKYILKRHLSSILSTDYENLTTILIDNNSDDGTTKFIKENYPGLKYIKNEKNLGFGRAYNKIFKKYPEFDYYAILNNDMNVEKNWLSLLVDTAESDPKIAAVGPKLLRTKKKKGKYVINSAGGTIDKQFRGYDRFEGELDHPKFNVTEEVGTLCGGAMLIRAEAIMQVGYFDDRMFLYYEDTDLCQRLRDKGWKLMYNGNSVVYHDHMATSGRKYTKLQRNLFSNYNRFLSLTRRKGILYAYAQLTRTIVEWLSKKITNLFKKINGS